MSDQSSSFVRIEGPLQLGRLPSGLADLESLLRLPHPESPQTLTVEIETPWFDITVLSFLAQRLQQARSIFAQVALRIPTLSVNQIHFLWRVGFWQLIEANREGSNLVASPDPWRDMPQNFRQHTNFTSYLHQRLGKEFAVQPVIEGWQAQLEDILVYPFIRDSDLIQSREYLFLLLWELLQNSQDHSQGKGAILGGQVFLEPKCFAASSALPPGAIRQLQNQHQNEIANSDSELRRNWLESHRDYSFLIISATDDGIGIPRSLRQHAATSLLSDHEAIATAFDPATSTRMGDPELFDVHGLSQVLHLVRDCDGYLFVQSGSGSCEYGSDGNDLHPTQSIGGSIAGTLFQIILPVSGSRRSVHASQRIRSAEIKDTVDRGQTDRQTLIVFEELGETGLREIATPLEWPRLVSGLFTAASVSRARKLYLDLVCIPPNRQFLSYLLRVFRKRNVYGTIVVVNASPELATLVSGLEKLDEGTALTETEAGPLWDADMEMSTILPRGQAGWCLPLLLPFSTVRRDGSGIELWWMGVSGVAENVRPPVVKALTHLFQIESAVTWSELWFAVQTECDLPDADKQPFLNAFKGLCRCNRALLDSDSERCEMKLSPYDLYLVSYLSLRDEFLKQILPSAEHRSHSENSVYCLGWRAKAHQFRKRFYKTWVILSDVDQLAVCSQLLIRTAFARLGEDLLNTTAIVSITPSAGLLGRRVAEILRADFWEAPSIYDLDEEEWLSLCPEDNVLIIDDFADTGTSTEALAKIVRSTGARCIAALALIRSEEGQSSYKFDLPIVEASFVSFGDATPEEADAAISAGSFYDIDPHSLEPIPIHAFASAANATERKRWRQTLTLLTSSRVIVAGHLVQAGHHYSLYFSVPAMLDKGPIEQTVFDWLKRQLRAFADGSDIITIVYPYYSPIHLLIRAIQSGRYDLGISKERLCFAVAKPTQRSGDRVGYTLELGEGRLLGRVVFIDDGIGTGGTLASVIDELINQGAAHILALILFDRIGYHPRKHLRRISTYEYAKKKVAFRFRSFFSANLRARFSRDCAECLLNRIVRPLLNGKGIVDHSLEGLRSVIAPVPVPFTRASIPTRLSNKEIYDVLTFADAVFSDTTSGREILRSVSAKTKSSGAKAEMLSFVLLDRKLNRQLTDKDACADLVSAIVGAPDLTPGARARFILHAALWEDKSFALRVLTSILPAAFTTRASRDEIDSSLDRYFNVNILDFCAAATALRHVVSEISAGEKRNDYLEEWRRAFAGEASPYGSVFLFELNLLLSEDTEPAIERARFLIANFAGTFSQRHEEALNQRIGLFLTEVHSENHQNAERLLPLEVLRALLDAIASVRSHFIVNGFEEKEITAIAKAYQTWMNYRRADELVDLLHVHFKSRSPIVEPATIQSFLQKLTPSTSTIIERAVAEFTDKVGERRRCLTLCNLEAFRKVTLLGRDDLLVRAVSHLLLNPVELRCGYGFPKPLRDLAIKLEIGILEDDENIVQIRVTDNLPGSTQGEIDAAFRKGGGLDHDQLTLRAWGGDLKGRPLPTQGSVFFINIQRSYPIV